MTYDFDYILNAQFLNNSGEAYLTALGIVILGVIIIKVFKSSILLRFRAISGKTRTDADDLIVTMLFAIHWPLYFLVSVHLALRVLELPEIVGQVSRFLLIIGVAFYLVKIGQGIIEYGTGKIVARKEEEKRAHEANIIRKMGGLIKVVLWLVAGLMVISTLGYDVSALMAGIGIGGIAIAFALQNILSDVFSSISIYLDKPFRVGDFIIIGKDLGVVKKIGIKSTRIQALRGEELIVSNRELTSTRVQNFKQMEKRRIPFEFRVVYDTTNAKLKKVLEIVADVIGKTEHADIDRVHFREFGDSSLIFEVVYYLDSSDYTEYMNAQQQINFGIKEAFEKEKIEFAYPTQTIMLNK